MSQKISSDQHHNQSKKIWSDKDVRQLISIVKLNPRLYVKSQMQFKDTAAKKLAWEIVGQQINPPVSGEEAAKKFKSLRDSFNKESKKLKVKPPSGSAGGNTDTKCRSEFYSDLEFLLEHIQPRKKRCNMSEDIDGDLDDSTQCDVGPEVTPPSPFQVNSETSQETVETVEVAWGNSMVTIPINLLDDVIPAVSNESTMTTIPSSLSSPPSFSPPPFSPSPRPASPPPVERASSPGIATPQSIREKAIHYRKHKSLGSPPPDAFYGRKQEKDRTDKGSLDKLVETASTVAGILADRHHGRQNPGATASSSNPLLGTVQFALAQVPNESHLGFLRDILKLCEVYKNGSGPCVIHDKDGKVVLCDP